MPVCPFAYPRTRRGFIVLTFPKGKQYAHTKGMEVPRAISELRYFAGWADKNHGQTVEVAISDDFRGHGGTI